MKLIYKGKGHVPAIYHMMVTFPLTPGMFEAAPVTSCDEAQARPDQGIPERRIVEAMRDLVKNSPEVYAIEGDAVPERPSSAPASLQVTPSALSVADGHTILEAINELDDGNSFKNLKDGLVWLIWRFRLMGSALDDMSERLTQFSSVPPVDPPMMADDPQLEPDMPVPESSAPRGVSLDGYGSLEQCIKARAALAPHMTNGKWGGALGKANLYLREAGLPEAKSKAVIEALLS